MARGNSRGIGGKKVTNVPNTFRDAERFPGVQFRHASGYQVPTAESVEAAKAAIKDKETEPGVKQFAQAVVDLDKEINKEHPELANGDNDATATTEDDEK